MADDNSGLRVLVEWKLEKFDGDKCDGDLPVETLEGSGELSADLVEEFKHVIDNRRA